MHRDDRHGPSLAAFGLPRIGDLIPICHSNDHRSSAVRFVD
jgi:hypothetical protein